MGTLAGDGRMAGVALSQQIADDIEKSIRRDELRQGAVIPPERELRERYQTTTELVRLRSGTGSITAGESA
jgi:DNA-binding GntR family transcriptional regulator